MVLGCVIAFVCAAAAELLATSGLSLIDWETDWAGSGTAIAIGLVIAAVVAIGAILVLKARSGKEQAKAE